jgi:hypothetical protein
MQKEIAQIIKDFSQDEIISDWFGLTLRQIFSAMEAPGITVFWGCWTEQELETVFTG